MKLYLNLFLIFIAQVNCNYYERCSKNNTIVFTFDDSPNVNTTTKLLKILNKYNVDATFFINGYNVEKNKLSKLIKKLSNTQTIASHTFSHPSLLKLNKFNIYRELYDNEYIFRKILKKRPLFFRPPYFDYNDSIVNITNEFGYHIIGSNLNIQDWKINNATQIFNEYIRRIQKNESYIILMHDYVEENIQIIERLIKYTKRIGYSIVSLQECLNMSTSYIDDNIYSPNLDNGFNF
jgi:peptidoglycan/xylan/chitin deacetylase (PgdA/CDA1 family)